MDSQRVALTTPASIRDLVTFQDGAIVSRVLLKNRSGTVTLFAFASGQLLSEHQTPYDALVHVVEGRGIFQLDGKDHKVSSGEVLLLPANIPHAVHAKDDFKMILTMIKNPEADEERT